MHFPSPGNQITIQCLHFEALDTYTLYNLLKLRMQVFCVEQQCVYQDLDDKDQLAWHLLAFDAGELVATARILMPGEAYQSASSIGRVVTSDLVRGSGIGRLLMARAVEECECRFPDVPICISAQEYLLRFYQSFGFVVQGEGYLEDDIPHIKMLRSPAPSAEIQSYV